MSCVKLSKKPFKGKYRSVDELTSEEYFKYLAFKKSKNGIKFKKVCKTTTPKSRKAKGRIFQQEVKAMIEAVNPEFEPGDISVAIMGEAGEDIKVHRNRHLWPFATECKRVENLNLWASWAQASSRRTKESVPVLIFRRSRSEPLVVLNALDFIKLVRQAPNSYKDSL